MNFEEKGLLPDEHQELTGGGECGLHWHAPNRDHSVLEILQETHKVVSVTADYTMNVNDDIVVADTTAGNVTITLPPSKGQREYVAVKAKTANLLIVNFSGTENCFGQTSFNVVTLGDTLKFKCYGGGWIKI